jgi:hypothetical protein
MCCHDLFDLAVLESKYYSLIGNFPFVWVLFNEGDEGEMSMIGYNFRRGVSNDTLSFLHRAVVM